MEAREQADYEEKRERIKPAFRLYLDREHACLIEITKEEYDQCRYRYPLPRAEQFHKELSVKRKTEE